MEDAETNRSLYLAVADLVRRRQGSPRTLEAYLIALWGCGSRLRDRVTLSMEEFRSLLDDAFDVAPPPFSEEWRTLPDEQEAVAGFEGWEDCLLRQIVDLREMAERGMLDDEHRDFGIDSPRGHRWYNFEPTLYLECGAAGSFDGWEPGDDTGRTLVDGPVGILDEAGRMTIRKPEDVPRPIIPIDALTWDAFRDFLECGQAYE